MYEQTGDSGRANRPLDKTWRWIRPDDAPAPAAQSGTVRAVRIMVIGGETEPESAPSEVRDVTQRRLRMLMGLHDCEPVTYSLASEVAEWRNLSLRDCDEVSTLDDDSPACAFARTQPAIDVGSLRLPPPSVAEGRSAQRPRSHASPQVAYAAAAAACVLSVLAATFLAL